MEPSEFKVYPARWTMLLGYSTCSLLNAVLWISFASIDAQTAAFYDVSIDKVNWLAIVFQVLYPVGMVFALYILAATTLRHTLVVGSGMGFGGACLRALSAFVAPHNPHLGYALCMAGQALGALSQPLFLSTPAVVAANWFGVAERDLATTVGALFNPLGNAVGQVIPPFVVVTGAYDDDGDDGDRSSAIDPSDVTQSMQYLLVGEAVALGLAFAFMVCVFQSHPPTPPSKSTQDRLKLKDEAQGQQQQQEAAMVAGSAYEGLVALSADSGVGNRDAMASTEKPSDVLNRLGKDFTVLLQNRNFNLLLFAFTVGLAIFNALLTCINQWLSPYGYTNDQAGLAGGVLIMAGLVGAGITAVAVDTYHCYREVLKGSFVAAGAALTIICLLLSRGASFGLLLGAFALMGLFTLPILPGVIENAVEVTYPIPEEASSGLLFCSGNLVGVAFTVGMSKLVADQNVDTTTFITPTAAFLLISIATCVALVLPYAGEYKRLAAEKGNGDGGGISGNGNGSGSGTKDIDSSNLLTSPLLDDDAAYHQPINTSSNREAPPAPGQTAGSPRSPQRSSPSDDADDSVVSFDV